MKTRKLAPGDSAPEFFLHTAGGVEMSLAACLLEGPLLIEFLRGTWDPDSRRRLDELARARESFRSRGARIVAIACERAGSIARYLEERPSPLPILADEDRRTARAYRVLQRFSLPIPNVARPASFLVDRCGFIRHAFVAPLQIHSADLEAILRVLDEVQAAVCSRFDAGGDEAPPSNSSPGPT